MLNKPSSLDATHEDISNFRAGLLKILLLLEQISPSEMNLKNKNISYHLPFCKNDSIYATLLKDLHQLRHQSTVNRSIKTLRYQAYLKNRRKS